MLELHQIADLSGRPLSIQSVAGVMIKTVELQTNIHQSASYLYSTL
jgi:hypothetical protein